MALVADNFAISAYGENEMTFHLLAIAHIVSFFFLQFVQFRGSENYATLIILSSNMEEYATFQ